MSSVHDRVQVIARSVFDDDELIFQSVTTPGDVPGWDSLGHVTFMYAVEDEFEVQFSEEEFTGFGDVGGLELILERKLGVVSDR